MAKSSSPTSAWKSLSNSFASVIMVPNTYLVRKYQAKRATNANAWIMATHIHVLLVFEDEETTGSSCPSQLRVYSSVHSSTMSMPRREIASRYAHGVVNWSVSASLVT